MRGDDQGRGLPGVRRHEQHKGSVRRDDGREPLHLCGPMVRWARRDTMIGKHLHTAFDGHAPELVPLD